MKKKTPPPMQIRVDSNLKDQFIACARSNDRTGSQLVRDFMRDYVKKNSQQNLPL